MSRLDCKSLNVFCASSKITVDGLGISTEGFGAGCGEAFVKVSFCVPHPLISITLASTKIRNVLLLLLCNIIQSFHHADKARILFEQFAKPVGLSLAHLTHGPIVPLLNQVRTIRVGRTHNHRCTDSIGSPSVEQQCCPDHENSVGERLSAIAEATSHLRSRYLASSSGLLRKNTSTIKPPALTNARRPLAL